MIIAIEVLILSLRYVFTGLPFWVVDGLIILVNIAVVFGLHEYFEEIRRQRVLDISAVLGKDAQAAFVLGELGLLTLNANFEITWVSELLEMRSYHVIGQKIMNWLPETKALFNNEADSVTVTINEHIYEVTRQEGNQTLYFKDVTICFFSLAS